MVLQVISPVWDYCLQINSKLTGVFNPSDKEVALLIAFHYKLNLQGTLIVPVRKVGARI